MSFNERIGQSIVQLASHKRALKIGAYLAFDGEPNIESALRTLAAGGHTIFLPVLNQQSAKPSFDFCHWLGPGADTETDLTQNAFGLQEPRTGDVCQTHDLSMLFIPLVAWDHKGNRLGMGGGYYDRVLAKFANKSLPRRIGVAYWQQKVESVPADPHDISLHGVLTERGLFTFPG